MSTYDTLELYTLCSRRKVVLHEPTGPFGCGIGGAWIEGIGEVDAGALNIPLWGREIIAKLGSKLDGVEIDPNYAYEWLSYGWPSTAVILSRDSSERLKAYSRERHQRTIASAQEQAAITQAQLNTAIPGLQELEAAYADRNRHYEQLQAMLEDEHNDGVRPPQPPSHTAEQIAALEQQYPRACVYLTARSYSHADNYHKSTAGDRAMQLLRDGGSAAEAQAILDNWSPPTAMWD